MSKYEIQAKIKDKWFVRGFIISMLAAFFVGFIVDVKESEMIVLPIVVITIIALCYFMYTSELSNALMNYSEDKKKSKK